MDFFKNCTEKEQSSLISIAEELSFKKDDIIFNKGDRNEKEVFIRSGIVRGYNIDEYGNEFSIAFFQQGEFMSTHTLRTNNGASICNYQALSNTKLLVFKSSQLKQLLSENKNLIQAGKEIKEREMVRLANRDECLMQVKATDKYLKFIKFYPTLESKISQRFIASYLGITPESLSRLKKNL